MSDETKINKLLKDFVKGKPSDMKTKLNRLKALMNKNPGAVESTKSLKTESDIKKLIKFTKPPVKSAEGPKKPTLRGSFSAEGKAPVEKKKGGEVKKKSKKTGKLALRGYGKSR